MKKKKESDWQKKAIESFEEDKKKGLIKDKIPKMSELLKKTLMKNMKESREYHDDYLQIIIDPNEGSGKLIDKRDGSVIREL